MTELYIKTKNQEFEIIQALKNNGFEYKQSYITFETYFTHLQNVKNAQTLIENSIAIKYNQNTKQSYMFCAENNLKNTNSIICTKIENSKIAKQILQNCGLFVWCEYACTNTIFEKQDIEINLCTASEVGAFLQIKLSQKNRQQLIEIIKSINIKIEQNYNTNIALEYYKKKYEKTI